MLDSVLPIMPRSLMLDSLSCSANLISINILSEGPTSKGSLQNNFWHTLILPDIVVAECLPVARQTLRHIVQGLPRLNNSLRTPLRHGPSHHLQPLVFQEYWLKKDFLDNQSWGWSLILHVWPSLKQNFLCTFKI